MWLDFFNSPTLFLHTRAFSKHDMPQSTYYMLFSEALLFPGGGALMLLVVLTNNESVAPWWWFMSIYTILCSTLLPNLWSQQKCLQWVHLVLFCFCWLVIVCDIFPAFSSKSDTTTFFSRSIMRWSADLFSVDENSFWRATVPYFGIVTFCSILQL